MLQKKIWKKLVLILTAFALIGSTAYFSLFDDFKKNPRQWQAYDSEDQRFNINFPSDPKKEDKAMEIANNKIEYQEVQSEHKDILYAVSYIDFPSKWRWLGNNTLLTKTHKYMMENESNVSELKQSELITYQGMPALNYGFIKEEKEAHGRLILSGNTLYRLTVIHPKDSIGDLHIEDFFNTFSLKS